MNLRRILFLIFAMIFGVFMIVYGGYDDSPGAQLLGLLVIAVSVVWTVRNKNKNRKS